MKYGIVLLNDEGNISQYCTSTLRGHFSDDNMYLALFDREPSAVKALKTMRTDRDPEGTLGGVLAVVSVQYQCTVTQKIPFYGKHGFVIKRMNEVYPIGNARYYSGPKTTAPSAQHTMYGYHPLTGATVFVTRDSAEKKIKEMRAALLELAGKFPDNCYNKILDQLLLEVEEI